MFEALAPHLLPAGFDPSAQASTGLQKPRWPLVAFRGEVTTPAQLHADTVRDIPEWLHVARPPRPMGHGWPAPFGDGIAHQDTNEAGNALPSPASPRPLPAEQPSPVAPQAAAPGVQPGAAASGALGLVSLSTSPTRTEIEVDRTRTRLLRMRRSILTAAKEIESRSLGKGRAQSRPVMVTLTYRDDGMWDPKHVSRFVERIQKWATRRGFVLPYVWVAELTQRGRVHYHCIFWVPRRYSLPKPDKQGWWPHGMTNVKALRSGAAYAAKYATKGDDNAFPKGLRLHGRGGLDESERMAVRWWCHAKWVREHFPFAADDVRKVVGGYLARATGEFLPSPWRVFLSGGKVYAYRIDHLMEVPF